MLTNTSPIETIIRATYSEAYKFGNSGEFGKAMKSLDRILEITQDDQTALHCKIVCLIQVAKFEEAKKLIEEKQLNTLVFERAYCEYRLNNPEKALKIIDNAGKTKMALNLKELRTQVLYRLEKYAECFESYKEIVKSVIDNYNDERRTNLSAVISNLSFVDDENAFLSEETYEQFFNNACIYLNQKKFNEALHKLRQSEKVCNETLDEEGANEEDIIDELAIIQLQIAYCMQMRGKHREATEIYTECLRGKPKDPTIIAMACNNSVVINKDQNVFDSKKKMRLAISGAYESKLNKEQKKSISLNNCLLALLTNAADSIQQLCQKLVESYPDLEFQSMLIYVAQLSKNNKQKDAVELLQKYTKTTKKNGFASKFAIVQLLLSQGHRKEAIEVLLSLDEEKYRPGVVSALVTLYLGTDNIRAASELLKSAVDWYKKNNNNRGDLTDMWRQAAEFHLRGGAPEIAASSLQELLKINPNDIKALAQLVIAYAQFDSSQALKISRKLPTLETLNTTSEIDALELVNWIMSTKAVKKSAYSKIEQSPATPANEKKKCSQRKRKTKLPKNHNAEVSPDPERWLPKYERSGFRKKRDRRAKDIIKGSQGMFTLEADQYDMSKSVNVSKNSPATSVHHETTPGPRQQQRKGVHKRRKGTRF